VLIERNVGENPHSEWQTLLAIYLRRRGEQWQIAVRTELRIRARENWYPIPERVRVAVIGASGTFPVHYAACAAPNVWIVDPFTLESQLATPAGGPNQVPGKTLVLPGTPIVIPLLEVMAE